MFTGREAELKFLKNVLLSNSKNTGRNVFPTHLTLVIIIF